MICLRISVDRRVYDSTLIVTGRQAHPNPLHFPLLSMLTKISSFANIGLHSEHITVEVGTHPGLGDITIVGLGDTAVQESKQRIRMAFRSSGFRIPTGKAITINLAPADVKKVGPRFDLAIALGILIVHDLAEIPKDVLKNTVVLGELALDGELRHVSSVLPATIAARQQGFTRIIVPMSNGPEAALIPGIEVIAAENFTELIAILIGEKEAPQIFPPASSPSREIDIDFADVRGQQHAKRALEIAAAGGHNVLMSGAPGAGKTLLARALRGILPPLSQEESIEVSQIYSVANLLSPETPLLSDRPFRIVHHTASGVSIVGGGQTPGPGEISLAHKGVLFLDELAEFPTQVLEVLRQPLEDQKITITRAQGSVTFPAEFLLVAAM
ncbi:magnesium chelatase, partial [Candidatus Peregrinibacteria bacterium CG22_combo_CG10-13_8_21_14_all_49_11]